ncbi:MAG: TatD family hydrolase [Chitinispirillales bacterium]|jgi:TatD DNase family protein|nr:TatD family hydrolase [Chitinispirillales bacterium]
MNCAWIDTHAHLFDCSDAALETLIAESASKGVNLIINTSVSVDTAQTVLRQCKRFPQHLRAAVGISPFDVITQDETWADKIEVMLSDPLTVAIGEIGLDCANPRYPPLELQMPVFIKQLQLAAQTGVTAIVHSRGMEKRTAEICRETGVSKAVFHCFTGDREAAEYILECGYYISISGIITYKNSHLANLIPFIPIDRLLIETDSPYLAPSPHRGKVNCPAFLIHTATEIAKLLRISERELSAALIKNIFKIIKVGIPL